MLDDFGQRIRDIILSEMDLSRELSDEEICDLIGSVVSREARDRPMTIKDRAELERTIFNSLRKLDVLQELVDDRDVTEIMVNGPNDIFYEKAGRIQRFKGHFSSEEKLEDVIQQIVGRHNRVVNQASPIVDTRLSDGSRVNIVLNPISIGGSAVSIRKFPEHPMSMERLVEIEALSPEVARLLQILTQAKYNIFISGGTGSGKTTFLNALSQYIPDDERIITIEDSAELQLLGTKNIVRLETRNANTDGVTPITIRDLIRTALRMRPDRIIVGECRGAGSQEGERKKLPFKTKSAVSAGDIVVSSNNRQVVFFEKTFKVTNESITGTIRYTANGETKPVPKGAFVSFEREVNGSRIGVMTIREDGRYELRLRKEYNFDWYIDNVELHYTVNGEVYHTMTKLNELFNNRDLVLTAATTE